ncbi:MAG: TetR/AcrR family transcriptional regulator [Nocardiopsaceae bacterium]|jgi:AcrR family transcriptional regulator|nr:TetR/AcrR family transcriptional regulator [Nocardiopsaceae bacterium]
MTREPGDRHDQILAVAAELFARKGVAATTVREIADEVGILSGSLYHHFDSKEAMVDEILSPYLKDLGDACQRVMARRVDPRGKLRDLVAECLAVVETHPHATEIYQSDVNYLLQFERFGYLTAAAAQVRQAWLEVLNDGVSQGAFRRDLEPRIVYRLMRDAIWPSVRWFRPSREYPLSRFAQECTSLFLDGLAVRAPAEAVAPGAGTVQAPQAARSN